MKLGTLLLGSAAALVVASAAQAADLPSEPTPAAVDYVKVCDAYGAGFFYIPGTETCLDISGRMRFWMVTGPSYAAQDDNSIDFKMDARVDFDTRSATELGTLRTFFRLQADTDGNNGFADNGTSNGVFVDKAFIQLGYLTVGYAANFFDSFGGIYGENDRNFGGETRLQVSVLADDIGGGFYAGIQALAPYNGLYAGFDGNDDRDAESSFPDIQAIVGINNQPWGSAAIAAWYSDEGNVDGELDRFNDSFWAVKAAATIKATEQLGITARTYYVDVDKGGNAWNIGLGVSYAATDAVTVYANGEYSFIDDNLPGDADRWGATAGIDYTVVSGLVATAEVSYDDSDRNNDDDWSGMLRLTREW